ncbi:MAG: hypothetical protein LBT39_05375, partial [Treponema sp.]|nr:hypothetical protein [Treponema sp.]
EYPLYTTLFPGPQGAGESMGAGRDLGGDTAALIARFCQLAAARTPVAVAPRTAGSRTVSGGLFLDTRYWNFGDLRLY